MQYILNSPNNCIIIYASGYTLVEVYYGGELKHKFVTSSLADTSIHINRLEEYGEYEITSNGIIDDISQYYESFDNNVIHDRAVLRSHICPVYNEEIDVVGWYHKLNTSECLLESDNVFVPDEAGFDSKYVLNIISISGSLPFDITVSGTIFEEEPDSEYIQSGENITITGTGYYSTHNFYIDDPSIYIQEDNRSFLFDIYRACPWTGGHENFTVNGCRFTWIPDGVNWRIKLNIYHFMENGNLSIIDSIEFKYDDVYKRGDVDKKGRYRRLNYDMSINGCNSEGLIVTVDQSSIDVFNLEIRYTIDYVMLES